MSDEASLEHVGGVLPGVAPVGESLYVLIQPVYQFRACQTPAVNQCRGYNNVLGIPSSKQGWMSSASVKDEE